jgi:hypothetical protein
MLLIATICAGAVVLLMTGAMVWLGIKALGAPRDRAAGNQMLQMTAALLGARFVERQEYPWYRRPDQYGAIDGELDGLKYVLMLMPWNAEDCGGVAMLAIRLPGSSPLAGKGGPGLTVFTPESIWHWPDRADPGALAAYVREAIAAAVSGVPPPLTS